MLKLILLSLLLPLLPSPGLAAGALDRLKGELDRSLYRQLSSRSQVGVVVGVIQGGETRVWGFGERVRGGGEAPDGSTFFEMGSITKTFTATLLAIEVLEAHVSLDQKVKTLWPELDGTAAGEITLEQLATHSSGLPRMPDNFEPADPENPYADYGEDRLFRYLLSFRQEKPAPYPYAYSNLGLGLLGHLITTKLHREDFGTLLKRKLLAPLGMNETRTALLPEDRAHAAQGYDSFQNPVPFWDLNVLSPAGVLKTTVNDLLKYARFQLRHGNDLLGAAAELTQKPRREIGDGFHVGLAWEVGRVGSFDVIAHNGATGGYRANLVIGKAKDEERAVVVLSNTDASPRCIVAAVFELPGCAPPEYATVDPERQRGFLGSFHAAEIGMDAEIFLENGLLGIHPKDQPKLRLWARSETEYEIPQASAVIRFAGDGGGFILLQNGREHLFKRRGPQAGPAALPSMRALSPFPRSPRSRRLLSEHRL